MSDPVGLAIVGIGFEAEDQAEQYARTGGCAITAITAVLAVEPRQPLGGTS